MEFHLEQRIEGRFKNKISVCGPQMKNKAVMLYNAICKKINIKGAFIASIVWFANFKKRISIKHAMNKGENSSADTAAADSYSIIAQEAMMEDTP